MSWGHLGVWGELASHKRYLTHRPSSQGWASRCPYSYMYMYMYICRLMRRRIKVADPRIFLVSAAYMHIREEVVDDNNII